MVKGENQSNGQGRAISLFLYSHDIFLKEAPLEAIIFVSLP